MGGLPPHGGKKALGLLYRVKDSSKFGLCIGSCGTGKEPDAQTPYVGAADALAFIELDGSHLLPPYAAHGL